MKLFSNLFFLVLSIFISMFFLGCSEPEDGGQPIPTPTSVGVEVEVEEIAYTYEFPNNESFPLHDYMSTQIARVGATPEAFVVDTAVYVLAISDIPEPVEAWRAYVYEQTGSVSNYTFRILYYTWTPNLIQQDFAEPIEIANAESTAGYIRNQDIWVAPDGTAYLMYSDQEVQNALLRDRFFPDKSIQTHLKLAIVKGNRIVERRNLLNGKGFDEPPCARFHVTPDGIVYAVIYAPGPNYAVGENVLLQIFPKVHNPQLIPIPLEMPLQAFLLASARAGNAPSYTIDFLGQDNPWWSETMYYAKVNITHTYQ